MDSHTLNSFEFGNQESDFLLKRINETLTTCPLLSSLYDDEFQRMLVSKRADLDNYLLWILAGHDSIANALVANIERCLGILQRFDVLTKFRSKLRQYETAKFKSVLVELYVPRKFAEMGLTIEFEPSFRGTPKNPDFKASNATCVFFEITSLFEKEAQRLNKAKAELRRRLRKIPEPFVFSLRVPTDLQVEDVPKACRDLRRVLQYLDASDAVGFQTELQTSREPLRLTIQRVLPSGHGHLGSTLTSNKSSSNPADIASKISKKTQQLPEGERGVLVIDPGDLSLGFDIVKDALYGDTILRVDQRTGDLVDFVRSSKRVFLDDRNTRVSAVYYYRWTPTQNGVSQTKQFFTIPLPQILSHQNSLGTQT